MKKFVIVSFDIFVFDNLDLDKKNVVPFCDPAFCLSLSISLDNQNWIRNVKLDIFEDKKSYFWTPYLHTYFIDLTKKDKTV
jgi:hypothetical protein